MHFLSINLISFRRSRGIVLVMASPAPEMDSAAPVDSEIQRKMCEMLGISSLKGYPVVALDTVCLNKTRYAGVCADWEQKLCVFRSRPNLRRHGQRHWQ